MIAKRIPFKWIILIIFFSLEINPLQPAEAVRIGKFEWLTDVLVERSYDDNVLLTRYEREGSSVSTIIPMISLKGAGSVVDVDASYNAHVTFYHGHSNQNQYNQTGMGSITLKPTEKTRIGMKGQDTYSFTKIDERDPLRADNMTNFNDILFAPYIEQEIGKRLKAELSCTYAERKYNQEDEDLEGSKTYTRTLNLHLQLNSGFSLDGGYKYTFNDLAKKTPDSAERLADGGFTWDIRSRIRISGRYGHAWQKAADSDRKESYPTVDSTIDLHLGKSTQISAMYKKSSAHISSHDTQNDPFTSHNASLTVRHNLSSRKVTINYGGSYNKSIYDLGSRRDKDYRGMASMTWKIFNPVLLSLTGDYTRSRYTYDLIERRDNSRGGGAGMEFKISRSMTLALNGNYTRSCYGQDSYQDNPPGYQDNPSSYVVRVFDGSSKFIYSLNKNIFIEAGYQHMKSRSTNPAVGEEDRNVYIRNIYTAGLKAAF